MKNTTDVKMFDRAFAVPFPTTGQFLDIQVIKAKLTEERYSSFISLQRDGLLATVICDAISTFSVLIGEELRAAMNVKSLLDLPLVNIFELTYAFKDQYSPYYEEIMMVISNPKQHIENTTTKDQKVTNAVV